jgi:hypothetical protein
MSTAYIGIVLNNGMFRVDTQCEGENQASISFPSDERGTELLKRHVADIHGPVRLAIVASTAALLSIAFALGEPPGREVFLVSALVANHPATLANYAARPV